MKTCFFSLFLSLSLSLSHTHLTFTLENRYAQLCAQVYKKSDSVFISRITKVRKNSSGKWEYDVGDPECKSPEFSSEDEARKAGQKAASFKRILLAKCQMEFQKQIDWDEFAKAYVVFFSSLSLSLSLSHTHTHI